MAAARWHEVHEQDSAIRSFKTCLQDHGVAAIPPVNAPGRVRRSNQPAAMVWAPKQGGEARIGIKARPAQPIYRSISSDKRRCLAIADQGVILNWQRHRSSPLYTAS